MDHGERSLVFRVKACKDVQVFLATRPNDVNTTHEIRLGSNGNQQSYLKQLTKATNITVDTPEILNCAELRYFWILWLGRHVEVGRGPTVGEEVFLSFRDAGLNPRTAYFLGFGTQDISATTWEIRQVPGM